MKRCMVITAYLEGNLSEIAEISPDDFVLCADAGYLLAKEASIVPDLVVGDFDGKLRREDIPEGIEVMEFPPEKDYTDGALCTKIAKERGFSNIMILGGLGGRLDHTMANLQNMFYYADENTNIMIADGKNMVFPLVNSEIVFPNRKGWKTSIVSHSDECYGVTTRGLKYTLTDAKIDNVFPIGVCNEGVEDEIYIKVEHGKLMVIVSKDA